jgi:hypothetical protein
MKINVSTLLAVVLVSAAATAEPPTKLRKLIDDSIGWFELLPSEESTEPMQPVVALLWDNNTRDSASGATVVWVAKGRPEAVVAIYPWRGLFCHEFDSLSRGTIVAKRDEKRIWNPETPGLQFRPIDDAPAPDSTRRGRLRQMKALSKQFKATLLGWKTDNSQREELRLMTTPLYRYKIEKPDKVLDGVIFAYASGTDPEVLLLIEAFGDAGQYRWEYAFVRRSSGGLQGRFRSQIVWAAKMHPQKKNPLLNHVEFSRPLDEALEAVEIVATP